MTPRSWNELPVELLRLIFDHLQHIVNTSQSRTKYIFLINQSCTKHIELCQSFAACQLVCKSWSREAQKKLYNHVYLGKNIAKFIQTITIKASQTALMVKQVDITNLSQIAIKQLFMQCQEITSIRASSPEAFNEIIWPVLLLDDVHLPKLQTACRYDKSRCNDDILKQFQRKYRGSLTTVHITKVEAGKVYLEGFRAVKTLNIYYCFAFQHHTVLDAILNECSSTLERLDINTLYSSSWEASSFEKIISHEKLQILSINSLRNTDSTPLQYFLRKFPNMSTLFVKSLHCENRYNEIEAAFWIHLLHLYTRLRQGHLEISLHPLDLSALVANSVHVLSQLDRNKRVFRITFRDKLNRPILSSPPHVKLIKDEESVYCELEAKANAVSKQQVLDNIHDWIQVYKPTRIAYSAVESIAPICQQFSDVSRKKEYAVVQRLSKYYREKSWKLLLEAIDVADEVELGHFVLCDPQQNILLNHNRQRPLTTLTFKACFINDTNLPDISRQLPEIDLLTFQCTSFLRQEKHVLQIFMPFTKINKLYISAATLNTRSWTGGAYAYGSPSSLNDTSALCSQKYTLKIETDSETNIYTIQGQDSEKLADQNADEVTQGFASNGLVWIKCRAFGKYAISCKGGVWSYYDLDHA